MTEQERKEQRIAVIEDVVAQLNAKRYRLCTGVYLGSGKNATLHDKDGDAQVKNYVEDLTVNCTICARGAIFLSYVRMYNNLTVGQVCGVPFDNIEAESTMKLFDKEQLDEIEAAFCGWDNFAWAQKYPDRDDRLMAICENVLVNDGVFDPQLLPTEA